MWLCCLSPLWCHPFDLGSRRQILNSIGGLARHLDLKQRKGNTGLPNPDNPGGVHNRMQKESKARDSRSQNVRPPPWPLWDLLGFGWLLLDPLSKGH